MKPSPTPKTTPGSETAGGVKPCPFCGKALHVAGGSNPYATCRTDGCWMASRQIAIPLDDPNQVGPWNQRTLTAPDDAGLVEREIQAVWRCALGDSVCALDHLKNKWIGSRRKAEREAGAQLSAVLDLVFAARNPAPASYVEATRLGEEMKARAALAALTPGDQP